MTRFVPILALAILTPIAAQADKHCSVPMTDWQPREAVAEMAEDLGWTVRRIRIDDGCYEILGTDAKGQKIHIKVDPATLAIVEHEAEDEEGHRVPHHD